MGRRSWWGSRPHQRWVEWAGGSQEAERQLEGLIGGCTRVGVLFRQVGRQQEVMVV